MKTIKRIVYAYKELSEEAKKRALDKWNETNDMPFLQSMLNDECGQMLKEKGITCTSNHPVCLYSLSHSQGDGLLFIGEFIWKRYTIYIKHGGRYYNSNSASIEVQETKNPGFHMDDEHKDVKAFIAIYQDICKRLKTYGNELIEEEMSEAHFIDVCNENDYTFTKDGVMMNE